MKQPRQKRDGECSAAITQTLGLIALFSFLLALTAWGAQPAWWSSRGAIHAPEVVTNSGVITTNYITDDYAAATQGQLKLFTVRAVDEMNANLAGGAGTNLNSIVANWTNDYAVHGYNASNIKPSDFDAMTVGQVKYVGHKVWSRLVAAGYTNSIPSWLALNTNSDNAVANIGQLKEVFNFTLSATLTTATPNFSPASGAYLAAQTVTFTSATPGATIYYTTNGTTPNTGSSFVSSGGTVTVSTNETLSAMATHSGYANSAVAIASYTIGATAATPTFSPVGGAYLTAQTVTLSSTTANSTIYYTIDGTPPTTGSPSVTSGGTVSVGVSETLKALTAASGYINSSIASVSYVIETPAASPTFSPAAGTYGLAQTIAITSTTPSSTIYYTTDGTAPTTSSSSVTSGGAVTISTSKTLKAMAVAPGYTNSTVASAAYVIDTTDSDGNGLADVWEMQYFGHLGNDPNSSPNGDGISLLDDFEHGYNPISFTVAILSGNNQSSPAGTFAPQPLVVLVSDGTTHLPLNNALVTFTATTSNGALLAASTGATTASTFQTRTTSTGQATVYIHEPNVTTFVTAGHIAVGSQSVGFLTGTTFDALTGAGLMFESWGPADGSGNVLSLAIVESQQSPAQFRMINPTELDLHSHGAPGFVKSSGWLISPQSGFHVLTLTGTNKAQLFLSTNATPANKQLIATITSGTQSSSPVSLTANTRYYYEVYLQTDLSTDQVSVGWTLPDGTQAAAIPQPCLVPNVNAGGVLWEFWNNIDDQALSALLTSKWYPNEPASRSLTSGTEIGVPVVGQAPPFEMATLTESSGSRLRGYLMAPQTGTYHFWVCGDDESEFLFSPTMDPSLATIVATVPNGGFTGFRQWNTLPTQQSVSITLQAGQWYYVEAREKNGHYGGFVSVAWTLPDGTFEGPIAAWHLNPFPGRLGNMPTVRFTTPAEGNAYVEGSSLPAAASILSPDSAITQASLMCDGQFVSNLTAPGYSGTIPPLSPGNHKITIQATDALNETAHDDVNIYVFPSDSAGSNGLSGTEQTTQTFTTPTSGEVTGITTDFTINGDAYSALSAPGDWAQSGNSMLSNATQGWIEYQVNVTSPDVYRVLIQASAFLKASPTNLFTLGVMIDGVATDTVTLPSGTVSAADQAVTYTPWLTTGQHTIRLIWQDFTLRNVVSINRVVFQQLQGPTTGGANMKDWTASRLQNLNTITVASASSQVSPQCIEGTVETFGDMAISESIIAHHGVASNWYANVPLSATQPTQVTVSFENGILPEQKTLSWTPTNLLLGGSATIRKGDSLLFSATDASNTSTVPVTIQVPGQTAINTTNTQPVPVEFDQAGTFTVTGSYYAAYPQGSAYNSGTGTTFTYTVTVVDANFGTNPIAWTYRPRVWDCANVPATVHVDSDPSIVFAKTPAQPATGSEFSALTTNAVDTYVVARLAPGGPILANAIIHGFWLKSSDEAYLNTVQKYPDGSTKVEMDVVTSLMTSDMNVVLHIQNASSLFLDGTINKTLTAADFDAHNTAKVFFVLNPVGGNSICHTLVVNQGGAYVGSR